MATQVTNYQCPSCTGPLPFSSSSGRLECEYCGSSFAVEDIEALYAQKDAAAAAASQQGRPVGEVFDEARPEDDDAGAQVNWGDTDSAGDCQNAGSADWGQDAAKMRAYNCPSCGAELICEQTTAATACPYCGNPTIVPGQFAGILRPDYVIPFKIDREAAKKALKNHYRKNIFLPRAFSRANHIDEIKGIYVPFWLYDTRVEGEATFHATNSITTRHGDEEITTTQHYQVRRGGSAQFARVPADGASKMPDDYMDSLEPYDYAELKPFSTAYLPGYLADKYDVSAGECAPRIDQRCRQTTAELLRRDVTGFMTVSLRSMDAKITHENVHYALLPVWLLHTSWKGKNYLYAMNGQTGKFVGELPTSGGRFWGLTAALTVALTGLTTLVGFWSWLLNLIGGFFG